MVKSVNKNSKFVFATKKFTDRELPREVFARNLKELESKGDKIKVVNYYGISGIGKSALLGELTKTLAKDFPKTKKLFFDFSSIDDFGDILSVLRAMERILKHDYKYSFPFFDLVAYTYETKLGKNTTRPELETILDSNDGFNFAMDVIAEIPLINNITKIINLAQMAERGKNLVGQRLHDKKFAASLKQIEEKTAPEVEKELCLYFAQDLSDNLKKHDDEIVIFFDTYEAFINELSVGSKAEREAFINGVNGLILNTVGALWIISGREKLRWADNDESWAGSLEQHLLDNLSFEDSDDFLKEAGVEDAELRKKLYDLTLGTPMYLDLCVDVYYALKNSGKTPKVEDFGRDTTALADRFFTYMTDEEKDLIQLLAHVEYWTDESAEPMIREHLGGFSPTFYEKVKTLSFVAEDNGKFSINESIRPIIIASTPKKVHEKYLKMAVTEISEAVKETKKKAGLTSYEGGEKAEYQKGYRKISKIASTEDEEELEILKAKTTEMSVAEIASLVRKYPENSDAIDLLRDIIRRHLPNYITQKEFAYTIDDYENVRSIAEEVFDKNDIILGKLYVNCPKSLDYCDELSKQGLEIAFSYTGKNKYEQILTLLDSIGFGDGPNINAKPDEDRINRTKKVVEKLLDLLEKNPDEITYRVLAVLCWSFGDAMGFESEKMIFNFFVRHKDFVKKTTDTGLLDKFWNVIREALGGKVNSQTEFSDDAELSRIASSTLRSILPRYEDIFGAESEIVCDMKMTIRKRQIRNDSSLVEEILNDYKKYFGVGTKEYEDALVVMLMEMANYAKAYPKNIQRKELESVKYLINECVPYYGDGESFVWMATGALYENVAMKSPSFVGNWIGARLVEIMRTEKPKGNDIKVLARAITERFVRNCMYKIDWFTDGMKVSSEGPRVRMLADDIKSSFKEATDHGIYAYRDLDELYIPSRLQDICGYLKPSSLRTLVTYLTDLTVRISKPGYTMNKKAFEKYAKKHLFWTKQDEYEKMIEKAKEYEEMLKLCAH